MKQLELLTLLRNHYPMRFDRLEFMREGGNRSYTVYAGEERHLLRVIRPAFRRKTAGGLEIHLFCRGRVFPCPR